VKTVTCSNCGADTRIFRDRYNLVDMGIPAVVTDMEIAECNRCGNEDPIIAHLDELMRTVVVAVVCSPSPLRGTDVRFLRKYIGMTAEEFARLLNVDKTTVSKWENDRDPVGNQSDRLIRLIVIGLGDGLEAKLKAVVGNLPKIGTSSPRMNIEVDLEKMSFQYA